MQLEEEKEKDENKIDELNLSLCGVLIKNSLYCFSLKLGIK